MKKHVLFLVMLLVISTVLTGCPSTPDETSTPTAVQTPAVTETATHETTPTPEPTSETTTTPTDTETATQNNTVTYQVQQDIQAMMPIMDSIVRTIGTGSDDAYAPRDEECFWTVIYLAAVNWGYDHPLMEIDGDYAIAPRQLMQEYASAAFLDYDDLLPIPDDMAEAVEFDESLDAYRLMLSDMGDTVTRLEEVQMGEDGSYLALVGLYSMPDDLLGTLVFTLVPNPYASGISDPTFLYTVSDVKGTMSGFSNGL